MKQLNFQLISNKNTELDIKTNYYIKEDTIFFKNNNEFYQFNINKKLFIKKDQEKELRIDINNNIIIIKLMENNYEFDMPIKVNTCQINPKKIVIEYTFMSDEQITNCIIIDY